MGRSRGKLKNDNQVGFMVGLGFSTGERIAQSKKTAIFVNGPTGNFGNLDVFSWVTRIDRCALGAGIKRAQALGARAAGMILSPSLLPGSGGAQK